MGVASQPLFLNYIALLRRTMGSENLGDLVNQLRCSFVAAFFLSFFSLMNAARQEFIGSAGI